MLVRLEDVSRQGQLPVPATAIRDPRQYRLPGYLAALGPKFLSAMRKETRNKTYAQVRTATANNDAGQSMVVPASACFVFCICPRPPRSCSMAALVCYCLCACHGPLACCFPLRPSQTT